MRRGLVLAIAAGLILGAVSSGAFAADKEVKTQVVEREVSGEVGGISPRFIAVVYDYKNGIACEMGLPMDKDTRVSGNKKLSEIGTGDIVRVVYEETSEIEDGKTPRITRRRAKLVELRRQADKRPEETGALTSTETQ